MPDPSQANPNCVTIVVLSRLVYRKGIDLLVAVIPRICEAHPKVRFVIGGDGPKRVDLEQMREVHLLTDRVLLLGRVKKEDVRAVLVQGNIFLNTSLTEAFCIAVVEAASCGLHVVSTKVGGIPEVLPSHMLHFALPEENDLVLKLSAAIQKIQLDPMDPYEMHHQVKSMYSWRNITLRTEHVYKAMLALPTPPLVERLQKYNRCGLVAGKLFCGLAILDVLLLIILEFFFSQPNIEPAPKFNLRKYKRMSKFRDPNLRPPRS